MSFSREALCLNGFRESVRDPIQKQLWPRQLQLFSCCGFVGHALPAFVSPPVQPLQEFRRAPAPRRAPSLRVRARHLRPTDEDMNQHRAKVSVGSESAKAHNAKFVWVRAAPISGNRPEQKNQTAAGYLNYSACMSSVTTGSGNAAKHSGVQPHRWGSTIEFRWSTWPLGSSA
jgi:hypothetical protein